MLSIRIVTAVAVLVMGAGGAAAQTGTTAPGKPIPLLQIVTQPEKAKARAHVKSLARTTKKTNRARHILARKRSHRPTQTAAAIPPAAAAVTPASAATSADVWPAPGSATAAAVAAAEPPPPAPAVTEPDPSELVVGGRTVQIASPDDVNEIDRAAKDMDAAASPAAMTTPSHVADAELESKPVIVARARQEASPVGSASWIAKVLAAIGGAVAAGSVAWFLIGSTPQRMYG